MAYNFEFPYTDSNRYNDDWILTTVKELIKSIDNFVNLNTIKYADPILWDITSQYEANTVVVDGQTGNAFISTKAVPSGVHLNNSDYWTQIYNYADVVDGLREQIAYNEEESTTATKAYTAGDLVFCNGLLYRVVANMIAGDSFVVDSNVVKTTIDDELHRLANSINNVVDLIDAEASAREDADTTLQDNIDAEASAREDADTTLQDNINAEAAAREDADNDLQDAINNLDINHVYNQALPTDDVTTNIGLKEGTYNITADTTINAQLIVPQGALLNVSEGVTLTINGEILAGRYQIFSGSGSIVVDQSKQSFGYPEWFEDADIEKCYAVFNNISLGARDYTITGNLHLTRSNTNIIGVGYGTYMGASDRCSRLIFNNGRLIIGRYDTQTISEYPRNINVKGINVTYFGASDAISIYGVVRGVIEDVFVITPSGTRGMHFYQAIGSFVHRCYVQVLNNTQTFMGYHIDNNGANKENASVWLSECTFSDTGTPTGRSYGFFIGGDKTSDVFLDKCEVATASVGLAFDGLSGANCVDVFVSQCDFDSIVENCILINNSTGNGAITLNSVYCAPKSDSTYSMIKTNSTIPTIIHGAQLIGTNVNQVGFQILANASLIGDAIIRKCTTPITNTGASTNVKINYMLDGAIASYPS